MGEYDRQWTSTNCAFLCCQRQTDTDVYETVKCSEYYNLISFESQICSLQNFEYSFFPGSALICSDTLTGIKMVDTYMKPSFAPNDRIIVYVRAKPFTAWMRSHVLDMSPLVSLRAHVCV